MKKIVRFFKDIKSGKKQLREFGIVIACAFLLFGVLLFFKKSPAAYWFGIIAVLFSASAILVPKILWPLQKLWMAFALVLGWIMTRIILSVFFFLLFVPIGIILRIQKKELFSLKIDKNAASYWITRDKPIEKHRYEEQY